MYPFHMSCKIRGDRVFQLKDSRFQFLHTYEIAPLMVGHEYVLADQELKYFLQSLDLDQVSYEPAVLWNRKNDEEIRSHTRIRIGKTFESSQIGSLDLRGYQLLLMDGYPFVSPPLKDALKEAGFDYLQFSEGLSEFVGD